jgi:uncharacterized membrane-anchored protein
LLLPFAAFAVPSQPGPGTFALGEMADITIPDGYNWVARDSAQAFLAEIKCQAQGDELGVLVHALVPPYNAVFQFEPIGFVKNPALPVNAAEALQVLMRGDDASDAQRERQGLSRQKILGWAKEPAYESRNGRLKWSLRLEETDAGGSLYPASLHARMFGREGVMKVTLACQPAALENVASDLDGLLNGFAFREGKRWEDAVEADKISAHDAASLVTGGPASAGKDADSGNEPSAAGSDAVFWEKVRFGLVAALIAVAPFLLVFLVAWARGSFRKKPQPTIVHVAAPAAQDGQASQKQAPRPPGNAPKPNGAFAGGPKNAPK